MSSLLEPAWDGVDCTAQEVLNRTCGFGLGALPPNLLVVRGLDSTSEKILCMLAASTEF